MGANAYAWVISDAECPSQIDSVWQFYYFDGTDYWYDEPTMNVYCN